MTTLNTIIEEEVQKHRCECEDQPCHVLNITVDEFTSAMQRVANESRINFLRSEIEKMEGEKAEIHKVDGEAWGYELLEKIGSCCPGDDATNVYEYALTSIITRYKEELLELTQANTFEGMAPKSFITGNAEDTELIPQKHIIS